MQQIEEEIIPRDFFYIDAMPGAGKTEFFVDMAVKVLKSRKSNLVYVAPTVALLVETLQRINRKCDYDPSKVHLVATPGLVSKMLRSTDKCSIYRTKPKDTINRLMGLWVDPVPGVPEMDGGCIVLTTHENFVQVSRQDKTGRDFKILRSTDVVFDEARHCIMDASILRDITTETFKYVLNSFSVSKVKSENGWTIFKIKDAPTIQRMKDEFQVTNYYSIPGALRELRKSIVTYVDSGRASVFMMSSSSIEFSRDKPLKVGVYTVLRPTSLFDYYRKVILTSAFFRDSQMYHFLANDGHQFFSLETSKLPSLKKVYERDAQLRRALAERLRVGVLLKSKSTGHRRVLTSHLLNNRMVLPDQVMDELRAKLEGNTQITVESGVHRLIEGRTLTSDPELNRKLALYAEPPLWVLIREAYLIIKSQIDAGYLPSPEAADDYENLSLMVLNVSNKTWGPNRLPYLSVVRDLYRTGYLGAVHSKNLLMDDALDRNARNALLATSPKWSKFLSSILHVGSPDRQFIVPSSNKLHGVNHYSSLKSFVHLAALNPAPHLITFYRQVLGKDYDIDQDHSIENLVQTLYRTNLRDPDSKSKVLLIVPYKDQAELLRAKVGCDSFEYVNEPRLVRWSWRKEVEEKIKRERSSKAGKAGALVRAKKWDPKYTKEVNACRVSISRYRSKIKAGACEQNVKKWEMKILEYQQRLLAIGAL